MRALVVDDSRAMRLILRRMLREVGFEVFEASNGREALEVLEEIGKTELMLVDWNMPEMNGYDFVCAVRSDDYYDNSCLMMVTTETEMEQVVKALEAGVNEYVMKPFTKEVILEKLNLPLCHKLTEQLASFPQRPILVLTGGDPMKRDDVFDIIWAGVDTGLTVTMTPSATPLVTPQAIEQLKAAGLSRLAVSLDGVDAATHDGIRGVEGSFQQTLQIIREARAVRLPVQINTMVSKRNVEQVDAMAEFIADLDIILWSVFFLVPVGRGVAEQRIAPEQYEEVFERLWHHAETKPYSIKTTEAHHYRRFVLQRGGNPQRGTGELAEHADRVQRAPLGVSDGKGCMFVSHIGQIFPSGFLPIEAGRFPRDSIVEVYQDSPIFKQLRDPDGFGGKCGRCEFRQICGGSRARAYAVMGDYLAAEPDCVYQPAEQDDI